MCRTNAVNVLVLLIGLTSLSCADSTTPQTPIDAASTKAHPQLSTVMVGQDALGSRSVEPEITVDARVNPAMQREGARIDSLLYLLGTRSPGTSTLSPPSTIRGRFSRVVVTRDVDGRVMAVKLEEMGGRWLTITADWQDGSLAHVTLSADGPNTRPLRAEFSDTPLPAPTSQRVWLLTRRDMMAQLKFKPAALVALAVAVALPAVLVFASEMMSQGRANPDHVLGTLIVATGIGAIALAVTRVPRDGAALVPYIVLGLAMLVQGYAMVGAVRPQLRQPFQLVSMALLASYLIWSIRRRLRERH